MFIDHGHQPLEVLGIAMSIQGRSIWPRLYEDEMSGLFLVNTQLVRNTARLLSCFFYQLSIEWHDIIDVVRVYKILCNHFQHGAKYPRVVYILNESHRHRTGEDDVTITGCNVV